ncbi:MAG: DUF1501 domain-containing protein [Fimbriimonadaceae bacterium]|nr:DUF1501 domain-containing protein [Fimbriimonadaceae bacterium]QYK59480.1 MAG: DUF1501 domain-containing protein [Fimbriimonadaceae bacterium]
MNHRSPQDGCTEYGQLSRRSLLRAGAFTAAGMAVAPTWLPQVAFAQSHRSDRDVVISVYLRGGADGLTMCAPHGEAKYYQLRPDLAVPPPGSGHPKRARDLDGFFGLPFGLWPLEPVYRAGRLAIVHAVGSSNWSRSHFDAQRWMENCGRDINIRSGWLGRHLATSAEAVPGSILRGLSMTYGMTRTMDGGPKTLPIPDVDRFEYFSWLYDFVQVQQITLGNYRVANDACRASVENTQVTIDLLKDLDIANYQGAGGAVYRDSGFGYAMKSTAALLKADLGVEAVHIDVEGWDTHQQQGSVDGYMEQLVADLGSNLANFHTDMDASGRMNWTLVVLSEFGRNVAQNNSVGTDHGAGSSMFVMGGAVNGGTVYRTWPGLDNLLDGQDLHATTDYRSVLAEIVDKRLGNGANLGTVFPDFAPSYVGIVR